MFERAIFDRLRAWTTDRSEEQIEGERLFEAADFVGAELHLVKAILEDERRQQTTDKRILVRLELAEAQRKQYWPQAGGGNRKKLDDAEQTILSAMEMAKRAGDRVLALQCLDALLTILWDQGALERAEQTFREAVEIEAAMKRRDPISTARRLTRIGLLRHRHGKISEAIEALTQSVAIHEEVLGPDHLATANSMSELAAAHHALAGHAETQRLLRRAIRVHEQQCGLDSPEAVSDLRMLTDSMEASGDVDAAAAQYERVLGLKLRTVGINLDSIASMQADLAQRYIEWRRYSRARELLIEAVGTFKRKGGPTLAMGYEGLGQIEEDSGHYHDALREWGRAGKVWESLQPEFASELVGNLEHRAFLLEQLRQHMDAAFLREAAANVQQKMPRAAAG